MEQIQSILAMEVAGNLVSDWVVALGVFVGIFIALKIFRAVVVNRIKVLASKTNNKIDDVVADFLHSIKGLMFVLIALFIALKGVVIPESLSLILDVTLLIVIVSQVVRLLEEVACMILGTQFQKKNPNAQMPGIFRVAVRLILWSIGLLLILSNLGINITSLVAGLGIGGLAISLALQSILSDLFASFSIAVDKPFEIGDFVIVGDHMGTVKHIGLKTTRISALEGEEIVISNAELTSARVQNYKKMEKRRIVFNVGLTYETPHDKLPRANELIGQVISKVKNVEFDRSHFFEFGDSALIFEVVFYMTTGDYAAYMDARQDINMGIHEAFEAEGLEMAFPTQTLHIKNER